MPYRRKNSPYWWVSITTPSGERVRRSTGTADRKEAKALENKWKVEAYRQQHWDEQPARSFDEVALLYLKSRSHLRSLADMRLHVKRLRVHFGGKEMNTLGPADVREYVGNRKLDGVTNATVNRELEVLSAAINHANREWALPNPVPGRHLDEPEGRLRWITKAEAAALLGAAETEKKAPHLPDFVMLALHTGMRRSEILGLEWRRAGITDFRVHDMRHTCAAWLVTAGVPLSEVRDLLGHSTVTVTERYAHLAPENVRSAVQRLDRAHSSHTELAESHSGHIGNEEEKREPVKSLI